MAKWHRLFLVVCIVAMATAASRRRKHRSPLQRRHSTSKPRPKDIDNNNNAFHERLFERIMLPPPWLWSHAWYLDENQEPGPNVCTDVKESEGVHTNALSNRIGTYCDLTDTAYKCITENYMDNKVYKTTTITACCFGFARKHGESGCPEKMAMKNLLETAKDLGLTEFLTTVDMLKLSDELKYGNYTLFAPVNGAFGLDTDFSNAVGNKELLQDSPTVFEVSEPALEKTLKSLQGAIFGHLLKGRYRSFDFSDEERVESGHPDGTSIRINFYARIENLMTANCIPVVTRDVIATNGVIHTVERALTPIKDSLMDLVRTRPDLTTLKEVLSAASHFPKLEEKGTYTLLAPTNAAFSKMEPRLRKRLLNGDKKCVEEVLMNLVLPHVICSSIFVKNAGSMNRLGKRVRFDRDKNGRKFADGARLVDEDIMAHNGVMHVIDQVLVPEEALGIVEVLEKQGFSQFLQLLKKAELMDTLDSIKEASLFAPTNSAIEKLPLSVRSKMDSNPDFLKKILTYHISPTPVRGWGSREYLPTLEGREIGLDLHRTFRRSSIKNAHCIAPTTESPTKTCNGDIYTMPKVLIPPIGSVIDVLNADKKFTTFLSLLKKAGMISSLQDGTFTVVAPSNKAFEKHRGLKDKLKRTPGALQTFLKAHIYPRRICCNHKGMGRQYFPMFSYDERTLSGHQWAMMPDYFGRPTVNGHRIWNCDIMASNGNVYEIHDVITNKPKRRFRRPSWRRWINRFQRARDDDNNWP